MKATVFAEVRPNLFAQKGTHSTYAAAIEEGQTFGFGMFYIDTGNYVPSREEQLQMPLTFRTKGRKQVSGKKLKLVQED